jgi:hypothetical protein
MGDLLRKELASPTSETGLLVEAAYSALQQVPGSLVCAGRVCSLKPALRQLTTRLLSHGNSVIRSGFARH